MYQLVTPGSADYCAEPEGGGTPPLPTALVCPCHAPHRSANGGIMRWPDHTWRPPTSPDMWRGPERSRPRLSSGVPALGHRSEVPFRSGQNVRLRCAISSVGHSVATIVSVGLRAFSLSTARFACAHLPAAESEQRPDESWCGTCQPERSAVTSAGSDGCVGWRLRFRRAADGDDLDR